MPFSYFVLDFKLCYPKLCTKNNFCTITVSIMMFHHVHVPEYHHYTPGGHCENLLLNYMIEFHNNEIYLY